MCCIIQRVAKRSLFAFPDYVDITKKRSIFPFLISARWRRRLSQSTHSLSPPTCQFSILSAAYRHAFAWQWLTVAKSLFFDNEYFISYFSLRVYPCLIKTHSEKDLNPVRDYLTEIIKQSSFRVNPFRGCFHPFRSLIREILFIFSPL